jgi:hypothetical protein
MYSITSAKETVTCYKPNRLRASAGKFGVFSRTRSRFTPHAAEEDTQGSQVQTVGCRIHRLTVDPGTLACRTGATSQRNAQSMSSLESWVNEQDNPEP